MKVLAVLILALVTTLFAPEPATSQAAGPAQQQNPGTKTGAINDAQQPKQGEPSLPDENWQSVVFVTPKSGWVASADTILHTDDGGKTWSTQTTGINAPPGFVAFVTPTAGWAVGSGTIVHTEDGGKNWKTQTTLPGQLYAVAFATPQLGVAVGIDGTIARTEDGGKNWATHKVSWLPGEFTMPIFFGATFITPRLGWVVGTGGRILRTEDGGQTWKAQNSDSEHILNEDTLNSVSFATPQSGWAVGGGTILHTENGGQTWTEQDSGAYQSLNSVAFATPQSGWAAGTCGTILHTADGGQTWTKQDSGTDAILNSVAVATPQSVWAVGPGAIVHSEDGGQTWMRVSGAPPGPECARLETEIEVLKSVAFPSPQSGWAVGSVGVILHTEDAGKTWTRQSSGTKKDLSSVAFTTPQSGWAVGRRGLILHTEDGGQNWKKQTSGTRVDLHSVAFPTPKWGWAAGEHVILQTEDGGQTWNKQTSGESPESVAFTTPQSGWAVKGELGAQGSAIMHTEDGGRTWQQYINNFSAFLHFVSFVTPQSGWAVGHAGVILHTEDGGKTWQAQTSGTDVDLFFVAFVTPNSGWAVGDMGTILHTENGGKTWKKQAGDSPTWLTAIALVPPKLGWAVGGGGIILHTEDGGHTWVQQAGPPPKPLQKQPAPAPAAGPSSPADPKVNIGTIKENQQFKSSGGMFSITVPPARNPFVRTYDFRESKLKFETYDYEDAVFQIGDMGQAYGAGVRRIPQTVLELMAKEEPKQTLSNLANKALYQWRDNYAEEPQPVDEAQVKTQFGEGLFRIYLAKRSSILGRVTGRDEAGKPKLEPSDARIAVLVVKKGDSFIYATAEDEYMDAGSAPLDLRKQLEGFFASMTVKFSE